MDSAIWEELPRWTVDNKPAKPGFTHQIRLVHDRGEAVIHTFWTSKAFNSQAYRMFLCEADKHFPDMRRVPDTTVAGFHYSNGDGTVVLELW